MRTKEKSCPSHMVKVWPSSGETSGDTIRRYLRANPLSVLSWQQEAHLGPLVQTQPTWSARDRLVSPAQKITPHIWLLSQHGLPLPLSLPLACFQQAILSHHKCLGGNHREALLPFPKITSARGQGQRGGACRPFCKSFKYPGTDPTKRIIKRQQPSFSFY